ncbi:hypothetical protein PVAG01_05342 [Phlyctema vagabunda]|uniref:Glycosyltransferase family 31 protein n=1 Tax=Phlyctema vagabunda TaxID=108571 RepID=A0ABR4PJW2_9HELO
MLRRLLRLHLRLRILTLVVFCMLLWMVLPYDNDFVLLVRWHFKKTLDHLAVKDGWLKEPAAFPISKNDVGMVIKTGFSTRERLVARLDAFEDAHARRNIVLVADYSTKPGAHFNYSGLELPVHDALAAMIENGSFSSRPNTLRLQYYSNLTSAFSDGNTELAHRIGGTYGWELDIMKKWYVLLDDDTYILDASLRVVLEQLDPLVPHYIGNAIDDYKARFAHGGSAVVFSQAAMDRIFIQNPSLGSSAHLESVDARLGDKLIATTAMRSGIYLDERYNRHFNGEPPQITRIRGDRLCAPIISFHQLVPVADARCGEKVQEYCGYHLVDRPLAHLRSTDVRDTPLQTPSAPTGTTLAGWTRRRRRRTVSRRGRIICEFARSTLRPAWPGPGKREVWPAISVRG